MAPVCILLGIILIAQIHNEQIRYNALLEGGHYTYGEITDVTTIENSEEGNEYRANIAYIVDEKVYNFSVTSETKYKKGDSVKVLYEEGNPSNRSLENHRFTFTLEYVTSCLILFMGIILLFSIFKVNRNTGYNQTQTAMQFNNPRDVRNYNITPPQRQYNFYQGVNNYTQSNHAQDNYTQSNH
jgi:hypothetical protein